ncbi:MAG: DUF922 domain-containing protein [Thermoanaerobaculia bacterium]|nr:DUF922 domain-containing protein [Thermoanaerobaculia bacterium]
MESRIRGGRRRRCRGFASLVVLFAGWVGAPAVAASRIDHEANTTWRRVTWDDFRGTLTRGTQTAGIASTIVMDVTGIEVEPLGDGGWVGRPRDADVYALMNKLSSGVQPGARSDWGLAHEQLHFDITEIHARRLWARVRAIEVVVDSQPQAYSAVLAAARALQAEAMEAMRRMQVRYDRETGNGVRKKDQKRWAREVAELLATEAPYPLL